MKAIMFYVVLGCSGYLWHSLVEKEGHGWWVVGSLCVVSGTALFYLAEVFYR